MFGFQIFVFEGEIDGRGGLRNRELGRNVDSSETEAESAQRGDPIKLVGASRGRPVGGEPQSQDSREGRQPRRESKHRRSHSHSSHEEEIEIKRSKICTTITTCNIILLQQLAEFE